MAAFVMMGGAICLLHSMAAKEGQLSGLGFIIVVAVIDLLFFLIGLFLLYACMRGWLNMFNLRRHGVVVVGHITAQRSRYEGGGYRQGLTRERYYATYSYDYQGKTYSHEQEVDGAPWEGKSVSVRCVAHYPTCHVRQQHLDRPSQRHRTHRDVCSPAA